MWKLNEIMHIKHLAHKAKIYQQPLPGSPLVGMYILVHPFIPSIFSKFRSISRELQIYAYYSPIFSLTLPCLLTSKSVSLNIKNIFLMLELSSAPSTTTTNPRKSTTSSFPSFSPDSSLEITFIIKVVHVYYRKLGNEDKPK